MRTSAVSRPLVLVLFACLALAPLAGHGIAEEPSSTGGGSVASAEVPLPLTSVVLYSSGVGYFVHDGSITGDADVALAVPVEEVNDFLKSLVVEDLDGGTIDVVRYGSREPAERALASYAVDLSGNPDLAGILSQARGEPVNIVAENVVSGALVSVTTRVDVSNGTRHEVPVVTVRTADGLETIDIPDVQRISFARPQLQKELDQAIETLSDDRTTDTRQIRVSFRGTGTRRVRVGYVRQTPVWKTTYRLVLAAEPRIQAWAIVENMTGGDWRDVRLSLVTGAPVSFRMNLYDPVYIERPQIDPPIREAVAPGALEQDVAESRASRPRAFAESAPLRSQGFDQADVAIDLSRGPSERSTARDLGAAFAYDIDRPVSIDRFTSALVPIVNRSIAAQELSIFDRSTLATNPLLGVRLSNSTGVHLMPGPITVFDEAGYSGDAQIGDVSPGSEAYLSYAIDLDVGVSVESTDRPDEIRRVRIVRGVLETAQVSRRRTAYILSNRGRDRRTVMIQHPKAGGWDLVEPATVASESSSDYRLRVEVAAGRTVERTVVTERVQSQSFSLSDLSRDRIVFYIETVQLDPAVRRALERIAALQEDVSEAVSTRRGIEQAIQSIYRDQERIRANLESLEGGSRLYDRYVSTLNDQEDELARLDGVLDEATAAEEAARKALSDFVSELSVG